jgi:hypothetical protein
MVRIVIDTKESNRFFLNIKYIQTKSQTEDEETGRPLGRHLARKSLRRYIN